VALKEISLEVNDGEFLCFLGPSGCGKTTLLRAIAGLDLQTTGRITQEGRDVSNLPPSERDFGIVFQSYALFPNLTINENIAFGLENAGRSKAEVTARVEELLQLVGLPEQGRKYPAQLSGGQQQRIALARVIVLEPAVLLLDEPLGALDARLRKQLQIDLKALQQQLGITFIYVTHDQEEALTMSDRIAVMNEGRVEQCGSPMTVYEEPETTFVADFLGTSNFITVAVMGESQGRCELRIGDYELTAHSSTSGRGDAKVVIRPERIGLETKNTAEPNCLPGMIERVVYMGSANRIIVRLPTGEALQVLQQSTGERLMHQQGDPVWLDLPADALRVLTDTGEAPLEEAA
jgi:putative 2-aminoethylphosphonate ABC transporter ATP-binding protein